LEIFSKNILIIAVIFVFFGCSEQEAEEYSRATRPQIEDPPVLVLHSKDPFPVPSAKGVAIEPGGKTVLITMYEESRLFRGNLITGDVTTIATIAEQEGKVFSGIAVEAEGATALATITYLGSIRGEGDLVRVYLATGEIKIIATGFIFGLHAFGITIEEGGEAALISEIQDLTRVNLNDGTKKTIAKFESSCRDCTVYSTSLAIEPTGQTVLIKHAGNSHGLSRINLATGGKTFISNLSPLECSIVAMALESSGKTIIATTHGGQLSCGLIRVDLATGQVSTIISPRLLGLAFGVALEEGGKTALVARAGGIVRVKLVP